MLLLHGCPDAPRGWRPVATQLHERGWRTIVPALRGSGAIRFHSPGAPRDGRGVALAADAIDLLDLIECSGHLCSAKRDGGLLQKVERVL